VTERGGERRGETKRATCQIAQSSEGDLSMGVRGGKKYSSRKRRTRLIKEREKRKRWVLHEERKPKNTGVPLCKGPGSK